MKRIITGSMGSLLMLALHTQAAVFYVDSTAGDDNKDCSSIATACKTLDSTRGKIASGDEVRLAAGTYSQGSQRLIDKAVSIMGGYNADFTSRSDNRTLTVITANNNASGSFKVSSGPNLWVTFDTLTMQNFTSANGVIYTDSNGGWVTLNNVSVKDNSITAKSPINMAVSTDKLVVTNSEFENNTATAADGGAIAVLGGDADISQSLFIKNTAKLNGGAITISNGGNVTISNATFYQNNAEDWGGAIANDQSTLALTYSTLFENRADDVAGGVSVQGDAAETTLFGNLFLDNEVNAEAQNVAVWRTNNKSIDKGYNIFGYGGVSGLKQVEGSGVTDADQDMLFRTAPNLSTTPATDKLTDIIVDVIGPTDNGGTLRSIKIAANSPARDKISATTAPFYGIGKNAANPFLSLQQAHSAMKVFTEYEAGTYYFDLDNGEDGQADGTHQFSTYVNKDGWVLVASGDMLSETGAAYGEVTSLTTRSDKILSERVVKASAFAFDEVRINTPENAANELDMISDNQNVISALKAYQILPNNYQGKGDWVATKGGEFIDSPTCSSNNGTAITVTDFIYDTCGDTNGVKWQPAGDGDVINSTGDIKENMDLWVRYNSGECDGTKISTDGRGLPKADWLNPDDANQANDIKFCDIGAFEFNDGYQLDCYDEDGQRPKNNLDFLGTGEARIDICLGGDLENATPQALINNIGSFNPFALFALVALFLFRLRKPSSSI